MDIVVVVLDLMHVHNLHGQIVNGVKMLFLELIVLPSILITEIRYLNSW